MQDFKQRVLLFVLTAAISWSTACVSDAREVQSLDGTWDIVFDHKNPHIGAPNLPYDPKSAPLAASTVT